MYISYFLSLSISVSLSRSLSLYIYIYAISLTRKANDDVYVFEWLCVRVYR